MPPDDEHVGAGPILKRRDHGTVTVRDIVGQGGEDGRGDIDGRRDEQVIRGGDGEEIRHRAAEAAPGRAESEGGAHAGAIGLAAAEASVAAGRAYSARDLERHEDAIAGFPIADRVAHRDHVGHRFVADGEGPREEARHGHGQVEIASSHRERAERRRLARAPRDPAPPAIPHGPLRRR